MADGHREAESVRAWLAARLHSQTSIRANEFQAYQRNVEGLSRLQRAQVNARNDGRRSKEGPIEG